MATSKSKNLVILFLAVTTLAGGILAWNQYQELIQLRGASLNPGARADLQRRLLALDKRNHELEAEIANLRARRGHGAGADAADDTDSAAGDAASRRNSGGRFNRRGVFNNLSVLLQNPEFNKLWTQQQKDRVQLAYAGLFHALHLTPEQADKLNSLLVEREQSLMDVLAAARDQGGLDRSQIRSLVQQSNSQIDSQIQSLLGPDGYAQYTNYLQTEPQRNQVNELQTRLAASGIQPLQDYQTQQLVQILAQNSAQSNGGGFFGGMGMIRGAFGTNVTGPAITQSAVTQASTVLTQDQMQVLQQMQQQQQGQRQIMDALRQSFRGGAATAPAPLTKPGG